MSVATMLEPFDTQMVEFDGDADVAMMAVNASTENWLQSESRMEEDAYVYQQYVQQDPDNEIEMSVYDETEEFEMADGENMIQPEQPELLDTELIDASNIHSPIPIQVTEDPSNTLEPREMYNEGYLETTTFDTPLPAQSSPQLEEVISNADLHSVENPIENVDTNLTEASAVRENNFNTEEVVWDGDEDATTRTSEHDHALEDHSIREATLPEEASNLKTSSHKDSEPNASDHSLHQSTGDNDNHDAESSGTLEQEHFASSTRKNNEEDDPSHAEITSSGKDQETPVADQSGVQSQAEAEEAYLELPPPILLSLRLSLSDSDQLEFALFTAPELSPEQKAESSSSTSVAPEEPLLLLQHRPMLYYEPVSSVFEALRHEEYFSHLDDLMEAEMALNAFDLQLLVSEDNIYAREVSLHDFNAMHVGIGLTGPLRVALESTMPRFINRYNSLREQISRLIISDTEAVGTEIAHEVQVSDEGELKEPPKVDKEEEGSIGNTNILRFEDAPDQRETNVDGFDEENADNDTQETVQPEEVYEEEASRHHRNDNDEDTTDANHADSSHLNGDQSTVPHESVETANRVDEHLAVANEFLPDIPDDDDWTEYEEEAYEVDTNVKGEKGREVDILDDDLNADEEPTQTLDNKDLAVPKSNGNSNISTMSETPTDEKNTLNGVKVGNSAEVIDGVREQPSEHNTDIVSSVAVLDERPTNKFSFDHLDDFDDEGEDEDAEGSLDLGETIQEDTIRDMDAALHAALLESEQFVESLGQEENETGDFTEAALSVRQSEQYPPKRTVDISGILSPKVEDEPQKPSKKRSLEDADLGTESETISRQPSEGNLKRPRKVETL